MDETGRVLIVAPVGGDAGAMAALLAGEGFSAKVCPEMTECVREIKVGAGAVLLTEEALESPKLSDLFAVLLAQPTWSELPLILLTKGGESRRARLLDLAAEAAGTITLLERPISTRTLVRSVQVALRSRQRQYQVRDLVVELKSVNETLEERVSQRTAEAVERAEKLRHLSAELSLAEERERRRIAQVLHDDLQQLLITAQISFFAHRESTDSATRIALAKDVVEVLTRSFELTRTLSTELAPPVLYECGLAAALEWLASQTSKKQNIRVTVETDPSADPQGDDVRIFLFQAVRELLLNAVKHARGSSVHVAMGNDGAGKVRIVVSDRGPGFDPAKIDAQKIRIGGFGLFSIRERVSSIGGEFEIQSAPGRGTRVTLLAPRGCILPDKPQKPGLNSAISKK